MKRISPATIIASLALFFSLTGAGLAASHYLITNIHQIKPSVRHQLRGERGPNGAQGAQGAMGPAGRIATMSQYGSPVQSLSVSTPSASLYVACPSGSQATGGGFSGGGEIVTGSQSYHGGWLVIAHLDPAGSTGTVQAWVECG